MLIPFSRQSFPAYQPLLVRQGVAMSENSDYSMYMHNVYNCSDFMQSFFAVQLRKELQQAKDVHEANTKKWRKEKEELEEKISKADVKVIDISGSYETLRQHNILLENQLSGKKSEADRLSKRLSESEQRQQNGFTEINIRVSA